MRRWTTRAKPQYASVVFDCDSTLSALEGIDALCADLPKGAAEQVAELTAAAMDGSVALDEVYERRLELVRPTRDAVRRVGELYVERMVSGARDVVRTLHARGVHVGIVSGGLRPAVLVLARALGIEAQDVQAVDVFFEEDGAYRDFDRESPLARSHGKVPVLRALRARHAPLLFVGDGVTDLEARPVVDLFVGYGGVVARDAVRAGAERFYDDADLSFVLDLVFPEEPTPPR